MDSDERRVQWEKWDSIRELGEIFLSHAKEFEMREELPDWMVQSRFNVPQALAYMFQEILKLKGSDEVLKPRDGDDCLEDCNGN